jgi:hypothetical protein
MVGAAHTNPVARIHDNRKLGTPPHQISDLRFVQFHCQAQSTSGCLRKQSSAIVDAPCSSVGSGFDPARRVFEDEDDEDEDEDDYIAYAT